MHAFLISSASTFALSLSFEMAARSLLAEEWHQDSKFGNDQISSSNGTHT